MSSQKREKRKCHPGTTVVPIQRKVIFENGVGKYVTKFFLSEEKEDTEQIFDQQLRYQETRYSKSDPGLRRS